MTLGYLGGSKQDSACELMICIRFSGYQVASALQEIGCIPGTSHLYCLRLRWTNKYLLISAGGLRHTQSLCRSRAEYETRYIIYKHTAG